MTACTLVGSPATVKAQLTQLAKRVEIDEIMAVTYIYDEQNRQILPLVKRDCRSVLVQPIILFT
ncbi:putative oxidoreductase [Actinobacillus equuli]|nr:putative oxidoreductase [Actinobacillus equuli]